MASPQIENGHTRIANELLEAMCSKVTNSDWLRIMFFTARLTYGWKRTAVESNYQAYGTKLNLKKDAVRHSLLEMKDKRLINIAIITPERFCISINKDYETWKL